MTKFLSIRGLKNLEIKPYLRIKLFSCKLIIIRITTRENLKKFDMKIDGNYPFC